MMSTSGERWREEVEDGKRGIMVMKGDLAWGGDHTL